MFLGWRRNVRFSTGAGPTCGLEIAPAWTITDHGLGWPEPLYATVGTVA
jgi:hypothetical protein